jgi:aspartate aminotransferase
VHDGACPFLSPAIVAPLRTVVTTGLSKNLALGGWRIGVARLPDGLPGAGLRDRLLGIGSEIWSAPSAPSAPIQQAAALAFSEPPEISERITRSRSLHQVVARAVAGLFGAAGLPAAPPQAAFYVYPDFGPWREHLRAEHGMRTGTGLAGSERSRLRSVTRCHCRGLPRRSAGSARSWPTSGPDPAQPEARG